VAERSDDHIQRVPRFLVLVFFLAGCSPSPKLTAVAPAAQPAPSAALAGETPARWADDVAALVARRPDVAQPVVFLGSSSIRLWSTLAEDMAPLSVLNYGFGGSKLFDSVHWCDTLFDGLDPRAVVVFSGTNDLAGDTPREPAWLAARFEELVARLRRHTDAPIVYIAITPTPAREQHLARVLETNRVIAAKCADGVGLHFLDTAAAFLDADGRPDPRWFVADRLHLAPEGYAQWTRALRPVLADLLDDFDG
jgi:hypothetical protein